MSAPRAGLLAHEHADQTAGCGGQDTATEHPTEAGSVLAALTAAVVNHHRTSSHQHTDNSQGEDDPRNPLNDGGHTLRAGGKIFTGSISDYDSTRI